MPPAVWLLSDPPVPIPVHTGLLWRPTLPSCSHALPYHLCIAHRLTHCHATLPPFLWLGTASETQTVLPISVTPKSST